MDGYRTAVTIIIDDEKRDNEIDFRVLNELQEFGLKIERIDHDSGVVEGLIETNKVHAMKGIWGVSYVREAQTYFAHTEASSNASGT